MISAEKTSGGEGYVFCLDGVRAASIILVIMAHTFPIGPASWQFNAMAGRMGMSLFFCLSGFLITSILFRDPRIIPFLVKRIVRIVPAAYIYLIFLVVFFGLSTEALFLNMAFISNYSTEGLISRQTSHFWSLAVEMHFYIAISIAVALAGRRAVFLVFPAALIVTGLRIDEGIISNINTHFRVDEILVGGWLAILARFYGDYFRLWLIDARQSIPLIALLFLLLMVSSHDNGQPFGYFRPYFTMLLVGAIMHCSLRPLLAVLESRPARYIARISYALYIWHPITVFGWMDTGSTVERYLMKRPISWTLTWFAAHVSTIYWEARFQKGARRYLKDRGY